MERIIENLVRDFESGKLSRFIVKDPDGYTLQISGRGMKA